MSILAQTILAIAEFALLLTLFITFPIPMFLFLLIAAIAMGMGFGGGYLAKRSGLNAAWNDLTTSTEARNAEWQAELKQRADQRKRS